MSSFRSPSVSFGPPLTRAVKWLVIVTSSAFVLTFLPAQLFHWDFPFEWLSLRPYFVTRHFFIWQLVTYLFLHGGPFHIIFNMLFLWMFGSDLERVWGRRRFLFYYFLTGIGAGVFDVVVEPSSPNLIVGCSGALYGLFLAFGLLFPDRPILFGLIFPMKAKWFALLMGGIEFFNELSMPGSGVSHLAHLGGMLVGFFYLRGGGLTYRWQLRYYEWRRARRRKEFEGYMRKQEGKDDAGRWIN